MSTAASPAASEAAEKKARTDIIFRFCPECSNMLYPKEDRATSQLLYVCRACHAIQKFDTNCTERKFLSAEVKDTAGVTTDVANDPTVGDDPSTLSCFCTMCGDPLRCMTCNEPGVEDNDQSEDSCGSEGETGRNQG